MSTSIIQCRVDDKTKLEATEIYEKLGIDLSTAIRMFLKRSVLMNGIPFDMTLPKDNIRMKNIIKSFNTTAEKNGISDMSLDEINAEIAAARKERKAKAE